MGTAGLFALAGCLDGSPVNPVVPGEHFTRAPNATGVFAPRTFGAVRVRVKVPYAVSVLARNADPSSDVSDPRNFDVRLCVPTNTGECLASFSLTPGERYVFAVEPLRIDDPRDHLVWANHRAVPVFESFAPGFESTVFVQSDAQGAGYAEGSNARKIDEYLDLAYARARPLPGDAVQVITIEPKTANVRVNSCTGVPDQTYVYGGVLFDPDRWTHIPVFPNPNSPAIAQYAARYNAGQAEPCTLVTAEDRTVILKGRNYQTGENFSGILDAFSRDPVNLTPDPSYVIQHYIPDPRRDAHPDIDFMTFGLLSSAPDQLRWKINATGLTDGVRRVSAWEFHFLFRTSVHAPEETLVATVVCNAQGDGACALQGVEPEKRADLLVRLPNAPAEFGRVDPSTGVGYVQILLASGGLHAARLSVRGAVVNDRRTETPRDFVPDRGSTIPYLGIFDGFAHWNRQMDLNRGRGRSLHIPF